MSVLRRVHNDSDLQTSSNNKSSVFNKINEQSSGNHLNVKMI